MKRAMRCHDFGSGREASRSQYREYWQGERQSFRMAMSRLIRCRALDSHRTGSHGATEISTVACRQRDISHDRCLMPILRFRFSLARRIER